MSFAPRNDINSRNQKGAPEIQERLSFIYFLLYGKLKVLTRKTAIEARETAVLGQ